MKSGARSRDARQVWALRAAEVALIALLALQTARLFYAAATPPGPVGRWTTPATGPLDTSLPSGVDPFAGGTSASGPVAATTLDMVLAGVRLDRATGRGAAILGRPGQPQLLYTVGEEVAPGVRLATVAFDHVGLDQGGQRTQLYMDQSTPAVGVAPLPTPMAAPMAALPPASPGVAAEQALAQEVEATPRVEGGVVTGYALGPAGSGDRFRALGLQPGDVLVAVDGRPVQQLRRDDMRTIGAEGAELQVERNGQRVSVRARP